MCQCPGLQAGDDLFDDRVAAVTGLGFEHAQRGVGEHRVVAVVGEQLALPGRDGLGVHSPAPADDQPAADVVGLGPGGERGEGHLGDFGVRGQALFVFVPDRVRVVDRGPRRLLDARDRCGDSGVSSVR
jgi:hypothetical protein